MTMTSFFPEVSTAATEWTYVREGNCTSVILPDEEQYEKTRGGMFCSLFESFPLPSFPNPCLLHSQDRIWVKEDAPCPQHTHNAIELCDCLLSTHVKQSLL